MGVQHRERRHYQRLTSALTTVPNPLRSIIMTTTTTVRDLYESAWLRARTLLDQLSLQIVQLPYYNHDRGIQELCYAIDLMRSLYSVNDPIVPRYAISAEVLERLRQWYALLMQKYELEYGFTEEQRSTLARILHVLKRLLAVYGLTV